LGTSLIVMLVGMHAFCCYRGHIANTYRTPRKITGRAS